MRIILWIIEGLVLLYFIISVQSGYYGPQWLGVLWFTLLVVLLFDLFVLILKQNSFLKAFPFTLLFIGAIGLMVFSGSAGVFATTANNANFLVKKIETYKLDHEKFPQTLDDLIPEYLNELPQTKDGRDFSYTNYIDNYTVRYKSSYELDSLVYYSNVKTWKEE